MHVRVKIRNLTSRSLAQSMDVNTMVHFARRLIRNYDLYERTGYPPSLRVPNRDAARQIVEDMIESGHFLQFVSLLIDAAGDGIAGRKYRLSDLEKIIKGIEEEGFAYDRSRRSFLEHNGTRRMSNWGFLREGDEYLFTFLRVDIVGNSTLVRRHPPELVKTAYDDLRSIVTAVVERRNGRVWSWEGDGGVAAFHVDDANTAATLAGMECIHEMFLYNSTGGALGEPLRYRIAIHNGQCEYHPQIESIQGPVIQKLSEIEAKHTKPDTLTISDTVFLSLEDTVARCCEPFVVGPATYYYRYELRFDN